MKKITIILLAAIFFASLPVSLKTLAANEDLPADSIKTTSVQDDPAPGSTTTTEDAISQWTAAQALSIDEGADLEELGVGRPTLLPDSPFYFLKDWNRGIQSFFTFDQAKKAELQLKFSSEKMAEAKELLGSKKSRKPWK